MNTSPFPEGNVSGTDRIGATGPLGSQQNPMGTPSGNFQSFMQAPGQAISPQVSGMPSPFDLPQGSTQSFIPGKPTMDTLISQVNSAQMTMGDLSNQMTTPNLKLSRAQRYLLKNKLSDARSHIRAAASKLNIEEPNQQQAPVAPTPLGRFLSILTDGQYQLEAAKNQLQQYKNSGKIIHPADMLLLQVKINKAQVEIEYASVLLAKAIEAMKQLFSIQI